MNDKEVKEYLKANGYPEHVVKGGRKGLVERWEKFVAEVEAGYSLNLEDYRNDLDLRAIIGRLGLQKHVADADRRLRKCLVFCADPVWECDENPDAFWIHGAPKNAKGELKKDLKAAGY
jgi:hypothetical protein